MIITKGCDFMHLYNILNISEKVKTKNGWTDANEP